MKLIKISERFFRIGLSEFYIRQLPGHESPIWDCLRKEKDGSFLVLESFLLKKACVAWFRGYLAPGGKR